jgi:hypothetical protein
MRRDRKVGSDPELMEYCKKGNVKANGAVTISSNNNLGANTLIFMAELRWSYMFFESLLSQTHFQFFGNNLHRVAR